MKGAEGAAVDFFAVAYLTGFDLDAFGEGGGIAGSNAMPC